MKFGMAVMTVLASLVIVNVPTLAAYAASSTPTGNDVSYPQCSKSSHRSRRSASSA